MGPSNKKAVPSTCFQPATPGEQCNTSIVMQIEYYTN